MCIETLRYVKSKIQSTRDYTIKKYDWLKAIMMMNYSELL